MTRSTVDLAAHINESTERTRAADFPVALKPVFYRENGSFQEVENRRAVVREDTGETLAVVSDRYTLFPHRRILDLVTNVTEQLNVGTVPRGIFIDHRGARMRALFKFPALAQPVLYGDRICPCIKVQNTYDGTSRIGIHIGAFRFVCTNLAVGGGGAFAGGFMAVHTGEIPVEEIAGQFSGYLGSFDRIAELYQNWSDRPLHNKERDELFDGFPKRAARAICETSSENRARTVYDAYNAATYHATHRMRSYRGTFDLLKRVNRTFQKRFPLY